MDVFFCLIISEYYIIFLLLEITDKPTYKTIIKGIAIYFKITIINKEIHKNMYFTRLFLIEYSLNFKENKGISAFIK